MLRTRVFTALILAGITVGRASAQQYQPTFPDAAGPQLIAVYISSTWCIGNRAPGLHEAVDSLKLILQERAKASGRQFRAVGVALDWSPDSGLAYLKEFGDFDELTVGRNWFNLAVERLVWADTAAPASIPQVLVYEQTITPAKTRVGFSRSRVVKRVVGGPQIVEWVRAGARIP